LHINRVVQDFPRQTLDIFQHGGGEKQGLPPVHDAG
jgi:hypothetical protein